MKKLEELTVAILAEDGFEQSELEEPYAVLQLLGIHLSIISPRSGEIRGWKDKEWGSSVKVDKTLDEASPRSFDALLLPGGVINPDLLRRDKRAVAFVNSFFDWERPVAAICHGPQLLIEADVVKDKKLTSFHSIQKDLKNAGAIWVDEEVVQDGLLITSRSPEDLDAFTSKFVEVLEKFAKVDSIS
ncbi:type 1 glutamine amidotransferase domain-containing protein [Algoriphagus litoralis]|uniref:type 1 glutamine amidotransferase domain-containing protein n=1 Tax=Algoriphagus litoralis TaxID=2202829 RepID=UPI000DB97457|nr:type 1 glutamine amidotransferase domain-containing protein [Algoriphagus litoralis]